MTVFAVLQTQPQSGWGIDRILSAVAVSLLISLLYMNWWLRDSVRDLIRDIHDRNGLREKTEDHEKRIAALEERASNEKAIAEHDKEMMQQVGRQPQRIGDKSAEEAERDPNYRYSSHKER